MLTICNTLDSIIPKLLPHQVAPVRHLASILPLWNALDLSDTGVGKTFVGAALAHLFDAPTLVVCPKIIRSAWHAAAAHFGGDISTINYEMVTTGRTPYGAWEGDSQVTKTLLRCENCLDVFAPDADPPRCYANPSGIHCVALVKKRGKPSRFCWHPAVKFLIFDEMHRCAGRNSKNSELLIAAKRQGIPVLGLTATAAMEPMQMKAIGYAYDLHQLDKRGGLTFSRWMKQQGVSYDMRFGGYVWHVSRERKLQVMAGINSRLIPRCGVRVRTGDIPGFPVRSIESELYDLPEGDKINQLYAEMGEALGQLDQRRQNDADPGHPLTRILRAREKIELLKVPVAVELAGDYVARGYSVALFVNFSSTMRELRRRLKCDCFIDGTQTNNPEIRQLNIDNFQADREYRIVVNSKAGGVAVSLHDVIGVRPRVGLVFPPDSARDLVQLLGRLHRAGAKSACLYRILFAAGTVEVGMHRRLKSLKDNLDALNDSDLWPDNLRMRKFDKTTNSR